MSTRKTSEVLFERLSHQRTAIIVLSIVVLGLAALCVYFVGRVGQLEKAIGASDGWVEQIRCGHILLTTSDGTEFGALGVHRDESGASLILHSPGKEVSAILVCRDEKSSGLSLFEGDTRRVMLGASDLVVEKTGATSNTGLSSLVLFDKDSKVVRQLP